MIPPHENAIFLSSCAKSQDPRAPGRRDHRWPGLARRMTVSGLAARAACIAALSLAAGACQAATTTSASRRAGRAVVRRAHAGRRRALRARRQLHGARAGPAGDAGAMVAASACRAAPAYHGRLVAAAYRSGHEDDLLLVIAVSRLRHRPGRRQLQGQPRRRPRRQDRLGQPVARHRGLRPRARRARLRPGRHQRPAARLRRRGLGRAPQPVRQPGPLHPPGAAGPADVGMGADPARQVGLHRQQRARPDHHRELHRHAGAWRRPPPRGYRDLVVTGTAVARRRPRRRAPGVLHTLLKWDGRIYSTTPSSRRGRPGAQ